MLELNPFYENNSTVTCILPEFILNNSKFIDKSADHLSLLLFNESLAIRRFKPKLNHRTKASKELIIFNETPAKAFTSPAKTKMITRQGRAVTRAFIGGVVFNK